MTISRLKLLVLCSLIALKLTILTQTVFGNNAIGNNLLCDETNLGKISSIKESTALIEPQVMIESPGISCSYTPITIKATVSNAGTSPTYVWKLKSEVDSVVTTEPALTRQFPMGTHELTLTVNGGPGYMVVKTSVQFLIVPPLNPGIIMGNITICPDEQDMTILSLTVASGGTGALPVFKYQWQQKDINEPNSPWTNIPGATQLNFKPSTLPGDSIYFRRSASSGDNTCDTGSTQAISYIRLANTANPGCPDITATDKNTAFTCSILPNPFTDKIQLSMSSQSSGYQVKIFDTFGILHHMQYIENTSTIETSQLRAGTYFLKIIDEKEVKCFKMVKD